MGSRADFLAKLAYWVGITEAPAGSNRTPIGESFGWNGVAWCAETVSEALRQSGSPWLREASVLMCRRRAEAGTNGLIWVPGDGYIEAGMAVLFDWNGNGNPNDFHIGTVVDPGNQTRFATIEGNYQDSVARVWRDRTYVQGFIRFPFPQPVSQPSTEEEDVLTFSDATGHYRCEPDGAVYAFDPHGKPGGRYLGGLNIHPAWQAGKGQVNGPPFMFGPTPEGGYVITTKDAQGQFHPYVFPPDGSLAKA